MPRDPGGQPVSTSKEDTRGETPPRVSHSTGVRLPETNRFRLNLGLERSELIGAEDLVIAFLMATPCGRAAKSSTILEGTLRHHLPIVFEDAVRRFLGACMVFTRRLDRGRARYQANVRHLFFGDTVNRER